MPDLSPPGARATSISSGGRSRDRSGAHPRAREERIPQRFGLDPVRDIQVLCPMNRGGLGARSLNIELQAALNPAGDRRSSGSGGPSPSATRSCRSRTTTTRRSTTATSATSMIDRERARLVGASTAGRRLRLRRARPAGAGLRDDHPQEPGLGISRCGHPGHDPALPHAAAESALHRVTRGKRLVVLVGQKKAVAIAVRNVSGRRRWSKLGNGWFPVARLTAVSHIGSGFSTGSAGPSRWRCHGSGS